MLYMCWNFHVCLSVLIQLYINTLPLTSICTNTCAHTQTYAWYFYLQVFARVYLPSHKTCMYQHKCTPILVLSVHVSIHTLHLSIISTWKIHLHLLKFSWKGDTCTYTSTYMKMLSLLLCFPENETHARPHAKHKPAASSPSNPGAEWCRDLWPLSIQSTSQNIIRKIQST